MQPGGKVKCSVFWAYDYVICVGSGGAYGCKDLFSLYDHKDIHEVTVCGRDPMI